MTGWSSATRTSFSRVRKRAEKSAGSQSVRYQNGASRPMPSARGPLDLQVA
jgi:hypothetical protein